MFSIFLSLLEGRGEREREERDGGDEKNFNPKISAIPFAVLLDPSTILFRSLPALPLSICMSSCVFECLIVLFWLVDFQILKLGKTFFCLVADKKLCKNYERQKLKRVPEFYVVPGVNLSA